MAGKNYTIFKQRIAVAPVGTPLVPLDDALGAALPTGWEEVENTEEGAMITFSVPKDDVDSDENGNIGLVAEGGDSITIAFTPMTPSMDLAAWLSGLKRSTVTGSGTGATMTVDHERLSLDKEGKQFMVMIEGELEADGLYDESGYVRAFGYKVEQTDEAEWQFRTKGGDAVFRPAATLRCLKTEVTVTQMANSGTQICDDRFDIFVILDTP